MSENFEKDLFEFSPFNIAIINKKFEIVKANQNFETAFGEWKDKKCYEVCKKSRKMCSYCRLEEVFSTGNILAGNDSGINAKGEPFDFVVYFAPIQNKEGKIEYIIEMSLNLTDTTRWQREYSILFERVPCYVCIIDREFKIVRANKRFRDTFGDSRGHHCYKIYKNRRTPCKRCPAVLTFYDGLDHTSAEIGLNKSGGDVHYLVTTTALTRDSEGVQMIMEISTDITEINELEVQMRRAHDFYAKLIQNSEDAIIALDTHGKTQIFNPAARDLLKWPYNRKPGVSKINEMMPEEFFGEPDDDFIITRRDNTKVIDSKNEEIPVSMHALELRSKKKILGRVAFLRDLREIRSLEKQKINADRSGAAGQTVNILTERLSGLFDELEDAAKVVDDAQGGKKSDMAAAWNDFKKKLQEVHSDSNSVLQEAKPGLPELKLISPKLLIESVAANFTSARKSGKVDFSIGETVKTALIEPDSMEKALTDIISYIFSKTGTKKIDLSAYEDRDCLCFEIAQPGNPDSGMDMSDPKLLLAMKTFREHGAETLCINTDGEFRFRISLNRPRLQLIAEEYYGEK